MRLFIAIDLELKDYFKKIQDKLPSDIAKLKNVKEFHLTLKFLGETEKVEDIKSKLKEIKFKPFKLTLEDIGVFPDKSYIKVVWIGLKETEILDNLQKQIEGKLEEFHFRKDFDFKAHVTLARVKFIKDRVKFLEKIENIKIENKEVEISEFKLIKSTLTEKGPIHKELEVFKAE